MTENGRVVIPIQCQRLLQLQPGEELVIRIENDELHVFSLQHSLKKAQNLVRKHAKNKSLVEKLKTMRREDSSHEK